MTDDQHQTTTMEPAITTRAEQLNAQLEALTSRSTRAAAQLRAESRSILRDVDAWTAQLQQFRVDAELARLDARDELAKARRVIHDRAHELSRRLEDARTESTAAWAALRDGLEDAVHGLRQALDGQARAASVAAGDDG